VFLTIILFLFDDESRCTVNPNPTELNDLRRIADELELKIHLASMDVHERWRALQPRLDKLEETLAHSREHASKVMTKELSAIRTALHELRDEITRDVR